AVVLLIEVETRLERDALDRGANRLTTHLKRIARQPHMTHRTGTAELHCAGRAAVVEYPASAARAVEAGKGEDLAGHEPFGLVSRHHLAGQRRRRDCSGDQSSQYTTREHAVTPTN